MSDRDFMPVFILTGKTGSGKTTFLLNLIEELWSNTSSIAGFAAVSVPGDDPSGSYEILDLVSNKILPLASRSYAEGRVKYGKFYFNPEGILMGKNILEDPMICDNDLVIVDEIGPFELDGKIWADSLTRLLDRQCCSLLLVVREQLIAQVIQKWKLNDPVIIDIEQTKNVQAAATIISKLGRAGQMNSN